MKAIIYLLIALVLFGSIATCETKSKSRNTLKIEIRSTEKGITAAQLEKSAGIIKNRLNEFKPDDYVIETNEETGTISVEIPQKKDLLLVKRLISQKGDFFFSEVYGSDSIDKILGDSSKVFRLLDSKAGKTSSPVMGCVALSDVEKINSYLITKQSPDYRFVWTVKGEYNEKCLYALKTGKSSFLFTGNEIEKVSCVKDKTSGSECIEIEFNSDGTKRFADLTKENLNRTLAVVVDDEVIFAPVIRSVITGGKCQITGNFSETETKFLTSLIKFGALPVSFEIVE